LTLTSTARFAALAKPRKGRPPKTDVSRFTCGKVREEDPNAVKSVALEARVRRALGVDAWKDIRDTPKRLKALREKLDDSDYGSALGLLVLAERQEPGRGITRDQYDYGVKWATLHCRYSRLMGFASVTPKSPGIALIAKETGDGAEPDEEVIMAVRRQWADCFRELQDVSIGHGKPSPYDMLFRVCLEDVDPVAPTELGNLRIALNALRRVFK
jgi:hypothetical protein